MPDPVTLTPQDFEALQLASPLQLLHLIKRLGVESTVIATWLGVKPAAVSQWNRQRREIPARYGLGLRIWAEQVLTDAHKRIDKEVSRQPTEELQRAVRGEFGALWGRWKLEVLHNAGTLHKAAQQQYDAMASWVRKAHYSTEDVESVRLASEALVHLMERELALSGEPPSAEDVLIARLTAAHAEAAPIVLTPEERAKAEADQPDVLAPEA